MFVCLCNGVTEKDIVEASSRMSLNSFITISKATTCCGTCTNCVKNLFQENKQQNEKKLK